MMQMDLMKQLAVPTILGKIQDGEFDVIELVEETGKMTLVVKVRGATKAETVEAAEKDSGVDPSEYAALIKASRGNKKASDKLKEVIYDLLSIDKRYARKVSYIQKVIPLSSSAIHRHLIQLQKEGKAVEVTGNKRHRKWIRKPVKIHVGGGISGS